MVKHNNMLMNPHYHKDWDKKMLRSKVKTWFNQPAKKERRRRLRQEKAKAIYPRPVSGDLRPLVRGQTQKYNTRIRFGRGFTLDELKVRFGQALLIAFGFLLLDPHFLSIMCVFLTPNRKPASRPWMRVPLALPLTTAARTVRPRACRPMCSA